MINGRRLMAPSDQAQALVLDELKFVDGSRGVTWEDDGSCVIEERPDHRLKRKRQTFLVVAKRRVR